MRVIVRTDADASIGGGHVMRCLALARELRAYGAEVVFLSEAETAATVPELGRQGFAVVSPGEPPGPACDLLIVDHYAIDARKEGRLAAATGAGRVAIIDDLADRAHDCDLLVDTTPRREASAYDGLVAARTRVLAGSRYAFLRPEFAAYRPGSLARRGSGALTRVLVSLGLTDVGGITARAVRAVRGVPNLETIDVVLGPNAPSLKAVQAMAGTDRRIILHVDTTQMADLMSQADLAIGAAGTTAWERCCLGLPSLVLVLAGNQAANAGVLAGAGAAIELGLSRLEQALPDAVQALGRAPDRLTAMSAASARLCDGLGAGRVAQGLCSAGERGERCIAVRRAGLDDAERLWRWRNDPLTRAQSRVIEPVPWGDHVAWLERRLGEGGTWLLVGEHAGQPIGTVRFDPPGEGGAREISLALAPESRGAGLAARLLAGACRYVRAAGVKEELLGWIKTSNGPSQACFERAGFQLGIASDDWVAATLAATTWPPTSLPKRAAWRVAS